MTTTPNSLQGILRSEGILLAAIPFAGSLIAFCFEVGYLSYFDVPAEYIEVGFNRIFVATSILSLPVALLWIYLAQIIRFYEATDPLWHVIARSMVYTLMPLIVALILRWSLFMPLGMFAIFVAAYLIPPALKPHREISYWERVRSEIKNEGNMPRMKKSRSGQFADILFIPLTVIFFLSAFCGYLGYSAASVATWHWVLEENPQSIVVRKYGDLFILKQFDPASRTLGDSIQLRKLGDGNEIRLKKVEVGELRVRPD